jgi:hypothetical protein
MDERSANGPSIARCNRCAIAERRVESIGSVRPRTAWQRAAMRTVEPPAGNESGWSALSIRIAADGGRAATWQVRRASPDP